MENLSGRGFGATCCACVSFAWEIFRDSPMVNSVSHALVIGGEVYVAWKRKMLHDVIGGYQAYIQRKIYLFMKPRISQLAKTTRALRARQDYKVATLGIIINY